MEVDTPIRLGDLTRAQLQLELKEQRSRAYVRWLSCLADVSVPDGASRLYLERYPDSWGAGDVKKSLATLECKAAVPPGSTTGADWGAPLLGISALASGFAAVARGASLLGRLPGLQDIPFRTKVPTETQSASYAWVGEYSTKPVSKLGFSSGVTLDMLKSVGIIVLTSEFVKLSAAGTELALRNTLVRGLVAFQDKSFLDPTSTAVPGQRPASITAGLTPVTNTGVLATDVQSLLNAFFTARPGAQDVSLIANAQKSAAIRALNSGGGVGLPIVPTEAAGANVIVVDGSGIFVADGGVQIDVSREASLQMNDAPDNPPTAATVPSNLWQLNLIGYRVERTLNWYAVPTSVAYLA